MEQQGWIKLHRKLLSNDVFRFDHNAWHVFEVLLLLVDSRTGTWKGGVRGQLADWAGLHGMTTYKALLRLEKYQMVTLDSNNKFTTVSICKWGEYQQNGNSDGNNAVTTREQRGNNAVTLQQEVISKKEELIISSDEDEQNPNALKGDNPSSGQTPRSETPKHKNYEAEALLAMQEVYDYYCEAHHKNKRQYQLTDKRRKSLAARLKNFTVDEIKQAIYNGANDPFWSGKTARGGNLVADLDYLIRNDQNMEKLLNLKIKANNDFTEVKI